MSGSSGHGRKKRRTAPLDDHLDLVPLIDCVFLLLLFFMLVGRLSNDQRTEQITVPPTKIAVKIKEDPEYNRYIINVFGPLGRAASTRTGDPPRNMISLMTSSAGAFGTKMWSSTKEDPGNFRGYAELRKELDKIWEKASKIDDPNPKAQKPPIKLPKTIIEIRADCDTEYRIVQEIQIIATDSMKIDLVEGLKPKTQLEASQQPKAFVQIDYTARPTKQ